MGVNGGTGARSRLDIPGVDMAGKTGTAQVRNITKAQRAGGGKFGGLGVPWHERDHALFICFSPVVNARYAAAVVIEHGISGSGTAGPIAKDVMTYLYDPAKAMARLEALEKGWGGDIPTRMASDAARWRAAREAPPATPPPPAADNATAPRGPAE
jgi:penicillin-binding protein 2